MTTKRRKIGGGKLIVDKNSWRAGAMAKDREMQEEIEELKHRMTRVECACTDWKRIDAMIRLADGAQICSACGEAVKEAHLAESYQPGSGPTVRGWVCVNEKCYRRWAVWT